MSSLSIEAILYQMDPILRIKLSSSSPAIRFIGRGIPLRYADLEIGDSQLMVKGSTYKIGVVREYPDYDAPEYYQKEKNAGGAPFDVGTFASPGCLRNSIRNRRSEPPSVSYSTAIHDAKTKLDGILEYLNEFNKYPVLRQCDQIGVAAKKHEADVIRIQINAYNEQKAISELKYQEYIMLTVTDQNGVSVKTEYLEYTKPLADVWSYFLNFYVLGLRGPVIEKLYVRYLDPPFIFQKSQLTARNLVLEFSGSEHLDNVMGLLTEQSIPLNSLESPEQQKYDHRMVSSARKLIICRTTDIYSIPKLSHNFVCYKQVKKLGNLVYRLIEYWKENGCSHPKHYIFETNEHFGVNQTLNNFENYLQRGDLNNFERNNFPFEIQCQIPLQVGLLQVNLKVHRTTKSNVHTYIIDVIAIP